MFGSKIQKVSRSIHVQSLPISNLCACNIRYICLSSDEQYSTYWIEVIKSSEINLIGDGE
jgi:hypothetical protein